MHEQTAPMKPEIKAKWVKALRSRRFKQGDGALKIKDSISGEIRHCCLGVLCELAIEDGLSLKTQEFENGNTEWWFGKEERDDFLPREVMEWAGIKNNSPKVHDPESNNEVDEISLADLNDGGYSFREIAELIKESL